MYKDIITYELADNITKEKLITVAGQVFNDWMKNQAGFIKWEIHLNRGGSYTDIVYWKSREDAKRAEGEMTNIPNASDWYACYKEGTISIKGLTAVAEF